MKWKICALLLSFSLSLTAHAHTDPHTLVAPNCLVSNKTSSFSVLAHNQQFTLIQTDDKGVEELIALKTKKRSSACGGFKDVTKAWLSFQPQNKFSASSALRFLNKQTRSSLPIKLQTTYDIKHEKEVEQLFTQINPENLWTQLSLLTDFHDRYANSQSGIDAAHWIKTTIERLAANNHREDVKIELVATGPLYQQPSVVVKIGKGTEAGIVISSHLDTVNGGRRPGADDNGSGSATVLEIARILLASNMSFKHPIYLIWHAAEEQGLVGSSYVVADFIQKKIPVKAVLHFDMTGYAYKNDPTMWLITDHINSALTIYTEKLITKYVKQPVNFTRCGYACSDHASWTDGGFAAAMPFEASFDHSNPDIHTSEDTIDKLSLSHMVDYVKLGLSFMVELAEPKI